MPNITPKANDLSTAVDTAQAAGSAVLSALDDRIPPPCRVVDYGTVYAEPAHATIDTPRGPDPHAA